MDWRKTIGRVGTFDSDWLFEAWSRRWDICGIIFLSVLVLIFVMLAMA